jgi:hypothetical protein
LPDKFSGEDSGAGAGRERPKAMIVRGKQFHSLSQAAAKNFVGRVAAHVGTFFPDRCKTLGQEAVRQWIELGIARAQRHGILAERDVCRYIDLMFELGRDYDQDPQLAKLRRILEDDKVKNPADRLDRMYREALRRASNSK